MARPRARRPQLVIVAALALVVAGLAGAWVIWRGDGSTGNGARVRSTVPPTTVPVTVDPPSRGVLAAACAGKLVPTLSAPIADPLLTEVSGVAATAGARPEDARTWVLNDSGDQPRIYGIRPDGSVQVVAVRGAFAVDWEDLAVGWDADVLWVADTGGNIAPRTSVQLYRMPIPGPLATSVDATVVQVDYPDGPQDVEAIVVEPAGSLLLLSKEAGESRIHRVDPGTGRVTALLLGRFTPGDLATSVVTGAAMAPDHATVAVRTYGATWLYPLATGQSVAGALRDSTGRCSVTGQETAGEAVGFLPDGSGLVTIGEGANPVLTTLRPPS